MEQYNIYPLIFKPILKDRIWGGQNLNKLFNKPIQSNTTGESWEISVVADNESIIENGCYKEKKITELIHNYPVEVLGTNVYNQFGANFPLLFKFLDAQQNLSIQLHPNDTLSQKRHNSFGKTEMWYVVAAEENAKIVVGFTENQTTKTFLEHVNNKTLSQILNEIEVKKGDVFYLETGTIHAIGKGIVIAEIQQTSDITYRIYDYDRKDNFGKPRELHIDLALEAINYNLTNSKKEYYKSNNEINSVVESKFFTTNFIPLTKTLKIESDLSSFKVYMCVEGSFTIHYNHINSFLVTKGTTVLIPAALTNFELHGNAEILEIHL